MKEVTTAYKKSMEQHIRNRSYCKVVLTLPDATTVTWTDDESYKDNRLVSVTINEYNSPIAEELPQTDATIILNNRDLYFDPMLESGIAASLVNGLSITISFGYDIKGDGVITWLAPTPLLLDTWQIGEAEVSLTAIDLFSKVVGSEKICATGGGWPAIYDIAKQIFEELGASYSIDGFVSYMDDPGQDYLILNPIPYTTAGELLQMLANAGHAYLYVDDNGTFHLTKIAAARPDYTVTSTGEHPLSGDYTNILNFGINRKMYTAMSAFAWQANGEAIFAPSNVANRDANAVWMTNGIAMDIHDTGGEACVIEDEFALEITLDAPVNVPQVRIHTGRIRTADNFGPSNIAIWLYSQSDMEHPYVRLLNSVPGNDIIALDPIFDDLIKIKVSNYDQNGNNVARFDEYARFTIASVVLGTDDQFTRDLIKRSDMFTAPTLSDENRIKSITVECDVPTTDGDFSFTGSIEIPANSTYTFTVEHDAVEGGNGIITGASGITMDAVQCGGFSTRFTVTNSNSTATTVNYQRTGTAIKLERKSLTVTYDTQGKELNWYNPLVNFNEAQKMADWIYSFYSGKFDMEFDWRGDPKFQAADMVSVERIDGNAQIGRIVETETSYAGTLRGRMTVRKVVM